jgi:hypothetical protein
MKMGAKALSTVVVGRRNLDNVSASVKMKETSLS